MVDIDAGVDLLVLDDAPLELAGRVALRGRLLFDDDAAARVRWQATTRKRYLDEQQRQDRLHQVFVAARNADAFGCWSATGSFPVPWASPSRLPPGFGTSWYTNTE